MYLLLVIISCLLIIQDVKQKKVSLHLVLTFLAGCLYLGCTPGVTPCFIPFGLFVFLGIVYYVLRKAACFGIADYFLVFGLSFLFPPDTWQYFITLCGAIGCIWGMLNKEGQDFPFIPAILLAFYIIDFCYFL